MAHPAEASWIQVNFNKHRLVDETEYVQLGAIDEVEYEKFSFADAQPSIYREWPTETNGNRIYKLASLWIEFGQSLTETERQTYSMLDLLGDIGGLFEALRYIGGMIMAPFTAFAMQSRILSTVFR